MGLTKLALKFAAAPPDIESFTRYLFIGPHPDDIEIGDILVIKPGEKIPADGSVIDGEGLINTSALTGESIDMVRGIAKTAGECGPELIFAPDPYTGRECHIDHLNAGRAAAHVAYFCPYPGIMSRLEADTADVKGIAFYMTAKPNRYVRVTKEMFRLQNEALFGCHTSQFPEGSAEAKQLQMYLKLRSADFGLRNMCAHAEGFRVLGQTHMHCIPETV